MRKWLLLLTIVLVAAFGLLYVLLPNPLHFQEQEDIAVNAKAFTRTFQDDAFWQRWWPADDSKKRNTAHTYHHNGYRFRITEKRFSSFVLSVSKGGDSVRTELFFLPGGANQMHLSWTGKMSAPANPFQRLQAYRFLKNVQDETAGLLQQLQHFYTSEENIYGFKIQQVLVVDSLLIGTSRVTKIYPSTTDVYSLVDRLKLYAQKSGAAEAGHPMLNVDMQEDSNYLLRVALPVNKRLPNEGDIRFRWMMGNGDILVGEVKGGPTTVKRAFAEMEMYVNDHNRVAPAIPFQSLVTDRRNEPDTSKWVTRIYWPVM